MNKTILSVPLFLICFIANAQTVDFNFQSNNGTFCNPATIQFTQNCTGNPTGFLWSFGNGLTSTSANPRTSYINGGSYTVKMTAFFQQGAFAISKTVVVAPTIVPKITVDRNYICQPGTINFSVSSNGNISNYDWNFGDTTAIVSTNTNSISHNYSNYGSHSVMVKAIDASGCFGSDTLITQVKKLPIAGTISPTSGCIPAATNITSSVALPVNSSVTSYLFDFNDGTPTVSGSSSSVSHSYLSVGTYNPTVSVTSNEGCTNTFNYPNIAFGIPPTNHIAYPVKSVVCGSETPIFVAKATNANSYIWNFGDGTILTVTDTITQHKYASLGIKNIKVTPYFNGCAGPAVAFQIRVVGVIASYVTRNTCSDKKTFFFNNNSQGNISSILWDFGDGSPTTTIANPTHTYPVSGQFVSSLSITDNITGCVDKFTKTIYTANPVLVNPDNSICKYAQTQFTIANNYSNPSSAYGWYIFGKNINGGTKSDITVKATVLGNFNNNNLIIFNPAGYCNDTLYLNHTIIVKGPNLDFTMPAKVCYHDTVRIINNSKPFNPADTVTLWYWNYGTSIFNDTLYQPAPIVYFAPQAFNVKLVGVDINGCRDSLTKRVIVFPLPFVTVFPKSDTLCLGQSDSLFAYHDNSIVWSPSAGLSCTTCDTVLAKPTVTTQYIVTATTNNNCSIQDSVLVKVIQPFTAVAAVPNQYICVGEQALLDVNPKNTLVTWTPANSLSASNIFNPVATPLQTTTYTALLNDSFGCFNSSVAITIFIKTAPQVDAGPDKILPYNSPFTIAPMYSSNVASYMWTPAANLNCSNCAAPKGIALTSETYYIKVVSDSGCVATDSIRIAIECKYANLLMPSAFTPNNDNLNDFYYPITRGIKSILRFSIYDRAGQIIFQSQNFSPNIKTLGWDGTYKGARLPSKAFVYVLEALCESNEKLVKSGSFILLR
ncbi:MAG: PKD domain-containing protein [Ferruginibacter sp.]